MSETYEARKTTLENIIEHINFNLLLAEDISSLYSQWSSVYYTMQSICWAQVLWFVKKMTHSWYILF